MSSLNDFQAAMERQPDDVAGMQAQADLLQEQGDPRGEILAALCEQLPDRTPEGNLSQDQSGLRLRYGRIMRGDVPIDLENLEATLQIQYAKQVELLDSLKLIEETEGEHFITAIDGKQYPLPTFDEILTRVQTPALHTKLCQGFDTLLLVPFGLPLERFLDTWRQGLRRNAATLDTVGAFNETDPVHVWSQYRTESLVYAPESFTSRHGGRTKAQLLATDRRGWDVLLAEGALQNLPREGQGQHVGGRQQLECNRTPTEYLQELQSRGEVGLTPEAYIMQFLDALQRRGQVLDTQTFSFLLGAFLPSSRTVPSACWYPDYGQANLDGAIPGNRFVYHGARAAVRVT
jgi:hypothetical protein